jgi:replication factor C small subunit
MSEVTLLQTWEPKSLDTVVGQSTIVEILRGYVRNSNIPHLLFTGAPGIGKTTVANCIARDLFGKHWRKNIVMMNASDERGIDVVRGKIKEATRYAPIGGYPFKIIFLDEMEEMTEPAQRALRETMIRNQAVTRFIFSVNNISKVIPPLQDRAQVFRFRSISHDEIKIHIMKIAKAENINISPQHLMLVAVLAKGSMRRALNALQSLSVLDEITEPIIRELLDTTVDTKHSRKLLKEVLTTDVEQYETTLFRLVYASAFEPSEILQGLMNELIALNSPVALPAVMMLADGDWKISQGANPMIQTRCVLFRVNQLKTKDNILKEMK